MKFKKKGYFQIWAEIIAQIGAQLKLGTAYARSWVQSPAPQKQTKTLNGEYSGWHSAHRTLIV
jgi:hypothetical protein